MSLKLLPKLLTVALFATGFHLTAFAGTCETAIEPENKPRRFFAKQVQLWPNADVVRTMAEKQPLNTEALLEAYSNGIFPWGSDENGIPEWFSPAQRAIFFLDNVHPNKSMQKVLRRGKFRVTIDEDFESVIQACATSPRKEVDGSISTESWITPQFIAAYVKLHRLGIAHSVEVWNEKGELVGGTYGIALHGVFAGESMFAREPNASKVAFYHLVDHLRSKGFKWIDSQVLNGHTASLGAVEVPRVEYMKLLREAQKEDRAF